MISNDGGGSGGLLVQRKSCSLRFKKIFVKWGTSDLRWGRSDMMDMRRSGGLMLPL